MESSIPYPPGFTPEKVNVTFEQEAQEVQGEECIRSHHNSDRCQTMSFTMDGCTKDMEKIIGSNGGHEV
ncbi:hypothetical protein Tco_0436899, partial [Tanacetum coccineum]